MKCVKCQMNRILNPVIRSSWLNLFMSTEFRQRLFFITITYSEIVLLYKINLLPEFSPTIITEERFCGIYLTLSMVPLSGIWLLFINVRECVYMKQPSGFWVSTKVVPATTSCPPFISMQVNYFSKSFNTMMQNLSLLLQQLDRFVFPIPRKW